MLVGVTELELFLGLLEIQVQHIVGLCYMVGYLYGKDRLTYIGVGKEAGQFPPHTRSNPTANVALAFGTLRVWYGWQS